MNKQEFLKLIRRGGEKVRASGITIRTGIETISGKGLLGISNSRFILDVTLDDPGKEPGIQMGIHGKSEFWELRGDIEDDIKFIARGLPSNSSSYYGESTRKSLTFSLDSIDLEPHGMDRLTHDEITVLLRNLNKAELPSIRIQAPPTNDLASSVPTAETPTNPRSEDGPPSTRFEAILQDFKLIAHNGGTKISETNDFLGDRCRSAADTYHGVLGEWKFGLIQRDADLEVHLQASTGLPVKPFDQEERLFRAFLNALAFTHGQHAWPFSLEHRQIGRLVLDRIHLHGNIARTPHAPFSERLDFNVKVNGLHWSFSEALEKSFSFFSSGSLLSGETTQVLYLLREASKSGVPKGIALLSICSLFESLIHVLYEELVAPEKAPEAQEFETAKAKTCDWLKSMASTSSKPTGYERLQLILRNAAPVTPRIKFQALVQRLSLKPEDKWQAIFDLWSSWRNPLSHRITGGDDSEAATKEALLAESKIAGAINCFILKAAGYSGWVRTSAYEDEYVQI